MYLRIYIWWQKIPHRKFGKLEKKDEFCFNLWLDENYLEIPKKRQNLKNAIDLIMLKPLINKRNTYKKFILSNVWAKKFVATGYNKKISNFQFLIIFLAIKNMNGRQIIQKPPYKTNN